MVSALIGRLWPRCFEPAPEETVPEDVSASREASVGESDEAKTFRTMQEARAAGEEVSPSNDRLIERYKSTCVR